MSLTVCWCFQEVVLERTWQRWSLLVLANAGGSPPLHIRKPLGHVTQINLTTCKYSPQRGFDGCV